MICIYDQQFDFSGPLLETIAVFLQKKTLNGLHKNIAIIEHQGQFLIESWEYFELYHHISASEGGEVVDGFFLRKVACMQNGLEGDVL